MKFMSKPMIAAAIILAFAGCSNPSGGPDPVSSQVKLTADDAAASDYLGRSVSISGDIAVVGTGYDDDDGSNSGSAYVFILSGGAWTQTAKLTADNASADDFADRVSASGDRVLIGCQKADGGASDTGAAFVFQMN